MRKWVVATAVLASLPAWGDTRFRVTQMSGTDLPPGKGQCDIRLQVDNEVEVAVHRDMVAVHTLAGQDARDDGSECSLPLPGREVAGFSFQSIDGRGEVRLVEPPSPRNDFSAIVRIHDGPAGFGRYHFRVTWDAVSGGSGHDDPDRQDRPRGPDGFVWNNVFNFHGRGIGESVLNEQTHERLGAVTVDIDRGAKIVVTFAPERRPDSKRAPSVVFTGTVMGRDNGRLRADMVTEDHRLHGTMTLSVDDRENVISIAMNATDGQDHLHLTWNRQ